MVNLKGNKIILDVRVIREKSIELLKTLDNEKCLNAYFLLKNHFQIKSLRLSSVEAKEKKNSNSKILNDYENYLISSGKADSTISTYISEAYKLLRQLQNLNIGLYSINLEYIFNYLAEAKESRNLLKNSYSRLIMTIRSFLSFIYKSDITGRDISSDLKAPTKEEKKREVLSDYDIKIIEDYFENRPEKFKHENLRDRIIFYLGIKCGLRKSEIMKLKWEYIDTSNSEIKIIESKGGNDRVVYFNEKLRKLLLEYKLKLGVNDGEVIRGKNGSRICSNSLQNAIRRLYKESGVYRPGMTLHSLRHTYAETLRKQGFDFSVIQALLGHKSLETTAKYLHVTKDDLKEAVI